MQFALKKAGNAQQVVGKLSFIDLAGSERGADTYDNDRRAAHALGSARCPAMLAHAPGSQGTS